MGKRWRIHPHDPGRIAQLERAAGVSPVVAQLLVCRGLTDPEQVRRFLDPQLTGLHDPEQLPGAREAAERIHRAAAAGRRIVIYGDYDADGMTGAAILYRCLQLLGADVAYYTPSRLDEGYGLHDHALEQLAQRGASLVVSVDCGVGSVAEAETARRLGLELIITDHHQPGERLPAADVIVHPGLPGGVYPFPSLCGAGVALKLAWAVCQRASGAKRVSPPMRRFLLSAVGLAALGTVADVVPLVDENRILVRHGLTCLLRHPVLGLQALLDKLQLSEKRSLGSEDIAFALAPRLNAAGRLGQAQLGVELLVTESAERAAALAEYIHQLNSDRETLERSIYLAANQQAKEQFDPAADPALVLAAPGWHPGVIGIVAGRLAEKYHRPVILVALDPLGVKPGVGSARSVPGLNVHEALAACRSHLISHGGHAAAGGLKIHESAVDAFRAAFCEYVAERLSVADRTAEIRIDAEAPLSQLTMGTVEQIEQLAPFGEGNPRPVLCATGVELCEPPRRIGGGQRHLALKIRQHNVTIRAVGFGCGDQADALARLDQPFDIAYRPVINDFRGRRSVEMHLVDWRPGGQPQRPAPPF